MAEKELDQLITSLMQGGRRDSTGRFTVDAARAEIKLQKFQLAHPQSYVLKLVQAAVAAGCKYVQVFLGRNALTLVAPLRGPTPFDLAAVLSANAHPIPTGENPAVRHLVQGLRAAQGVGPTEIRLLLFDSGEAWIHREQPLVLDIPVEQRFDIGIGLDHGFAVQLVWPRRWWPHQLAGEHNALYHYCRYSPVEVLVDQRPVNLPGEWVNWGGEMAALEPRESHCGVAVAVPSKSSKSPPANSLPIEPRGRVRRQRAFLIRSTPPLFGRHRMTVIPVWNGVALSQLDEPVKEGRHNSLAVVCVSSYGLAVDLSEFQVVQDEAYRRMLAELISVT